MPPHFHLVPFLRVNVLHQSFIIMRGCPLAPKSCSAPLAVIERREGGGVSKAQSSAGQRLSFYTTCSTTCSSGSLHLQVIRLSTDNDGYEEWFNTGP